LFSFEKRKEKKKKRFATIYINQVTRGYLFVDYIILSESDYYNLKDPDNNHFNLPLEETSSFYDSSISTISKK
jgi:hypothetical protein